MKKIRLLLFIVSMGIAMTTFGQQKETTPPDPAEMAKLKAAIEANPNDLAAHEAYLKASGFTKWGVPEDPAFVKQYEDWMKKYPTSATVAYALGHAYAGKESPKAKTYLLRAVQLDPKFDKAYFDLWIDAERWGDEKLARDYLLKAKKANPKSADYAFYYANQFSKGKEKKYRKLSLKVVKDFPNTERGAQALYWLANRTQNDKRRVEYYEMQKRLFPAAKFNWTASGMSGYFDYLLRTEPSRAVVLAKEILDLVKSKGERDVKTWQANISTAENVIKAQELLATGKGKEASEVLAKVAVPRYGSARESILFLKAKALDATGKSEEAYKTLLLSYVKEPTESLHQQLVATGSKVGKDASGVSTDVWYVRDTAAKPAPNFSLYNYYTQSPSALSDYKGKVVLVTYWFPGCGPCRGEFPHFENVVRKFKGRNDFVYLGINIVDEQDDYVLPFMRSTGYSFIPLRDDDKWQKGPLDNRGAAPVNFLIDQNGKIIFSNFRTDGNNEATLEMMIDQMLNKKKNA